MIRKLFFFSFLISNFLFSNQIGFDYDDFKDSFQKLVQSSSQNITILSKDFTDKTFLEILKENKKLKKIVILSKSSVTKKYSLKDSLSIFVDTILFVEDSLLDFTIVFNSSKNFIVCNKPIQPKKYSKNLFFISSSDTSMFEKVLKKFIKVRKNSFSIDSISDTLNFNMLSKNYKKYENQWIKFKAYVEDVYKSKKSDTYFIKLKGDKNFTIVIFESLSKEFLKKNINILYFKNKNVYVEGFLKYDTKYGYEIILERFENIKILQ
ncbi:MAG: hypothetical protein ABIN39_06260 [candidate division WOR-3 bacterium]